MQSIVENLPWRAAQHPDRPVLIAGAVRVSYGELWKRVLAAAHQFTRAGLGTGDR